MSEDKAGQAAMELGAATGGVESVENDVAPNFYPA